MSIFETASRGGAVVLLLLLATLALRDRWRLPVGRYGALFSLSAAASVVAAPLLSSGHHRALWLVLLRLLSIGTPALFWLWTNAHFDDDFVPSRWTKASWPALIGLGAVAIAVSHRLVWYAVDAAALLFVAAGVWRTLAGMAADLVENRRQFRAVLAISAGLYILATILSDVVASAGAAAAPASTISAAGVMVIAFAFAATALSRPGSTEATMPIVLGDRLAAENTRAPAAALVDAQEAASLAALRTLMVEQKAHREEGVSIAALASRLGLPEYRLRRLINQRLGHRNFSSFINGYRIDEAKAALADPTQAAVPVLTIALDAGFQSLGPFNRAFKTQTGMTPTEFRRRNLGQPDKRAAE